MSNPVTVAGGEAVSSRRTVAGANQSFGEQQRSRSRAKRRQARRHSDDGRNFDPRCRRAAGMTPSAMLIATNTIGR